MVEQVVGLMDVQMAAGKVGMLVVLMVDTLAVLTENPKVDEKDMMMVA